jgi:hypothetical protein
MFLYSFIYLFSRNHRGCGGQSTWHAQGKIYAYRILVGKHEWRRPRERPLYRWEGIDCIYLAVDTDKWQAVTDTIMDLCIL